MALDKVRKLTSGVKIRYWRVVPVTINYDAHEVLFIMAGYQSEALRLKTNAPEDHREIPMKGDEFDQFFLTGEDLRVQCYKAASFKDPFFKEATRVD